MAGYLDGEKMWEITDDAFKEAGKAGLWSKADSHVYFDAFTVTPAD